MKWVILMWLLFIAMMLMCAGVVNAHDDKLWKDSGYSAHGQKHCGMGYILAYTGEQTWQPYLFAGHWHKTPFVMATPSCLLMFQALESYREKDE